MNERKPLGRTNYGSIAHLPGSRTGVGDHHCHDGQYTIACVKTRDKHDRVIVTEKLDGSNVGIARIGDTIYALTRAGYLADTSPHQQHHIFNTWVHSQDARWLDILDDGERLCGEWLIQAHGTRYNLPHDPLVVFDIMRGSSRALYAELEQRAVIYGFVLPRLLSFGPAYSIEQAMANLGTYGYHGALDAVEGAVWRVERKGVLSFMAKYVRPDKQDGMYLESVSGKPNVWNTWL